MALYASELAALIGRHKYQNQDEALAKAWQRLHPASYRRAAARVQFDCKTEEQLLEDL